MIVLIVLHCVILSVLANNDESGEYVPDQSGHYVSTGDEALYIHDNSGQYVPDESGRYADDGSGRYSGQQQSARFIRQKINNYVAKPRQRQTAPPPRIAPTKAPSVVRAAPPPSNAYSNSQNGKYKIIRYNNDVNLNGYRWDYETENKIISNESGELANVGSKDEAMRSKGFYQYTGPDNVVYSVSYTADENGFVAEGAHLPTPPPIPEALLQALSNNRV